MPSIFGSGSDADDSNKQPIPEDEDRVMEKTAKWVVRRRMSVPAILFLESIKPLNYIGSQALVFFEPIVQTIFSIGDYDTFRSAMERRENVENLLRKIEKYDAILYDWEKRLRKFERQEKKKWKWYQRYLKISRPKIDYPEDLAFPEELKPDKKDKKSFWGWGK